MAAINIGFKGGERLNAYLSAMNSAAQSAKAVRVGFLEKSTYPEQKDQPTLHVAQVATWNEWGTSTAPARPFFRGMIKRESPSWGGKLGSALRSSSYDARGAFSIVGADIKDALTESIATWPADNAPSTVRKKGFDHGLVDKGIMQRSTDFEVVR